ncbi:unnamed protein product [Parnassius mnemosyne]|uniref:Uncharacterized protein n=1 Tax=Parnassius mnemosyne TaxID=213953 RepID=A0AAV1L1F1_9NEOP
MTVNATKDLRINKFKVKRVTLPVKYKTFISNAKRISEIISNIDKNIVTNTSKSWRIMSKLTLTSGIRKEMRKNENKIPTFNKLQYSINKELKRNKHYQENKVNISNKYMNNNDISKSEEINTEESFLKTKTRKLKIITPKNEETHVKSPQSKRISLLYSKHSRLKYLANTIDNISDFGESDYLKEFIVVYIPLTNLEHVDKNSNSGRKNAVNDIRLRRGVIEEEISATTSSGFKYTAAESSLVDRLAFKNINV